MIRRIFSTFIDFPSNHHLEFFQPSSTVNPHRSWPVDNLSFLFELAPCFPVNANKIRVISEPTEFYESILSNASTAKNRIAFASLYLGIGKLENDLVNAIQRNLKENRDLKVNILLDYTRGTRGKKNSKVMLMPLVQESDNCKFSLYHTPMLRGMTKRLAPGRYNELIGLQHMKIYLFDDTVILSGANLSSDYFTNRQDRYIEIKDGKLSDFFSSVIEKVQEFSMKVNRSGEITLHESWKHMPYEGDYRDFANEAKQRLQSFFHNAFEDQSRSHVKETEDVDTWIFPTLEMGQLNVHHDSLVTKKILESAEDGSTLNIATGYFNLTQTYMDTLVNECKANCSIIMAHPNANGFKGSKGPAGGIPDAYTLIARKFYEQMQKSNQDDRISLLEYERDGWTYHAKGLWYHSSENPSLPCMTVIGSSNYGERSVNRDLESQICLVTTNPKLQKSLKAEYDHLMKYASTAESQLVSRLVPNWVKTVVFLFKKFF
jgi:CDP-diacylglycerol--glycerol-3-phosphate 3-phosphatidyltransferase